ncbi:hypothetical protein EV424DRAFT_1380013 [Suillus variegatus]|nr:hypothetical protein EV424DRAFT_1380013 [Suillus variegatus]
MMILMMPMLIAATVVPIQLANSSPTISVEVLHYGSNCIKQISLKVDPKVTACPCSEVLSISIVLEPKTVQTCRYRHPGLQIWVSTGLRPSPPGNTYD